MADFEIPVIAKHVRKLINDVQQLKRVNRVNEQAEDTGQGELASLPVNNPFFSLPFMWHTTIITSVDDETRLVIGLRVTPNTVTTTPWVVDPAFSSKPLSAIAPLNVSLPEVGDYQLFHFTGSFGSSLAIQPRYGLFGAGGGEAVPTIIKSVSDDFLVCRTFLNSEEGTDDVFVAKPYLLRRSPFDGGTRANLSFTYTNTTREATVLSGPNSGISQTERVVPSYLVGDILIATSVSGGTRVTSATLEDLNNDARQWTRFVE